MKPVSETPQLLRPNRRLTSKVLSGAACLTAGVALLWTVFYFGIYLGYGNWKNRHHKKFAERSVALIAPAAEMNEVFEVCRNYITYNEPGGGPTWNTLALFEDRYEFHLQVPIEVDSPTEGRPIGPPRMVLLEIESIRMPPDAGASVSYSENWRITPAQWQAVVAAGGDFSAINIQIKTGQPVGNFAAYASRLRPSE